MKTILELDITEKEGILLKEMLIAMNISFSSQSLNPTFGVSKKYSENEIKNSILNCLGIWKNRTEFENFEDFRKQAWGGRGV